MNLEKEPLKAAAEGETSGQKQLRWRLTDTGNAERLVDNFGQEFRYSKALDWLVWDGRRWKQDEKGQVSHLAKRTVRRIYKEAVGIEDDLTRARIEAHARKSESRARREAMMALAQSEPRIAVAVGELDTDPWLFNVQNGTLDLRTGGLSNHRRTDMITKLSPVEYAANAPCLRWQQFLEEVQPDPEVRAFLQRLAGYAMTGVIREHVLPINFGDGRNGKGVFVDTLLHVFGDYGKQVPTELLMVKRSDAHPTERATLFGCRFAAAVETEQERALNVALVKQLTGGDRISARYMRKDFFDFTPTHKLMVSTNHRPVIKETKDAIWERVLLIPWAVKIPQERRDLALKEKLQAEASGILRWAAEGCLAWMREGLNPPNALRAATEAYRVEQDSIAGFLEDNCIIENGPTVPATLLFESYQRWCADNGERPASQTAFGERLTEKGFTRRKSNGRKLYQGLRLATAPEIKLRERFPQAGMVGMVGTA